MISSVYDLLTIDKLSNDFENIKNSQMVVNEQLKSEHKFLLTEIDQLKAQIIDYQTIIGTQKAKLNLLEKEVSVFKCPSTAGGLPYMKTEKLSTTCYKKRTDDVEMYSTTDSPNQNKLEENVEFFLSLKLLENSISTAKSISQVKEQYEIFKNEVSGLFNSKNQKIEELSSENKKLEEQNSILKSKVLEYEEENNKGKFCLHCHEMFTQKFNDEKSCVYHPGKLKYYSCRGCGADEYYTCCVKCSKCSKGCKIGKHVAG